MDPSNEVILSILDPSTVVSDTNDFDSDSLRIDRTDNKKFDDSALVYELNLSRVKPKVGLARQPPPISVCEENMPEVLLLDENGSTAQSVSEECQVTNAISSDLESNAHSKPPPRKSNFARRPTATVVRSLASSTLAEQYQQLAEKKNVITDYTLKKLKVDLQHAQEAHGLKIKLLKMEIMINDQQLQGLANCQVPKQ
nr:unnamed protein product [Callosobruchus analis]